MTTEKRDQRLVSPDLELDDVTPAGEAMTHGGDSKNELLGLGRLDLAEHDGVVGFFKQH